MTQGNVTKLIMAFAIPVLLGNDISAILYHGGYHDGWSDSGVNSLAAIGASASLSIWLLDFGLVFPWVFPS